MRHRYEHSIAKMVGSTLIRERAVFLFASNEKAVLVRLDALRTSNCAHRSFDAAACFYFDNHFSIWGFNTESHPIRRTQQQEQLGLTMDVVVGESAAIFKLLSIEDEPLLLIGGMCQKFAL